MQVDVLVDGLDHPEGVAWGPDGYLYAGGEAGQIYRISMKGECEQIASTGGFILGLCLDAHCNIYACDMKAHAVMRITQNGVIAVLSEGCSERRIVTPNFPVFDRNGNLYVSDSGDWKRNNGAIMCVTPCGETRVVSRSASQFPNGLAIFADKLFVALSNIPSIASMVIHEDGSLGPPDQVIELPGTVPDGLAFDQKGNLYIGCYTPDTVFKLSPCGELEIYLEDWESTAISAPTNIAFCGLQLSTMVLASLGRWHLAKCETSVAGAPLYYPHIPL